MVWDLGANTGRFSRIAAKLGRRVVSWDIDPAATERHYQLIRRDKTTSTLPLLVDLGNPSPALGWAHVERRSLQQRADADVLMALALVHHMAIGRNLSLDEHPLSTSPTSRRRSSSSSCPRATRWSTSSSPRVRTSSRTTRSMDFGGVRPALHYRRGSPDRGYGASAVSDDCSTGGSLSQKARSA